MEAKAAESWAARMAGRSCEKEWSMTRPLLVPEVPLLGAGEGEESPALGETDMVSLDAAGENSGSKAMHSRSQRRGRGEGLAEERQRGVFIRLLGRFRQVNETCLDTKSISLRMMVFCFRKSGGERW